nr:unnamed protein product [Callosobruchus chinensis]
MHSFNGLLSSGIQHHWISFCGAILKIVFI